MTRLKKITLLSASGILLISFLGFTFLSQFVPTHIDYLPGFSERIEVAKFDLPENMGINLFASEKDFNLGNVVAINFDSRGRCWALTMPTYPHYLPGDPPVDKLLILEDTDGDGRADKQTIFVDSLYLPTGFEFGEEGVYIAEQSNLLYFSDTDGDDVADVKKIVLQGFGTEDSHHAPSAFEWGPDGALYFHEGLFTYSQIETPYGVVRVKDGCTFKYHPRTELLEPYINYEYLNPWGQVFDEWGRHIIADASDGSNYFGDPMSGKINYPFKHRVTGSLTTKVRPSCGIEIVSSRHFPDDMQGEILMNTVLHTHGIWKHHYHEDFAGFKVEEKGLFLQGKNPNFRPVDLQFAPDGTLYLADWYNPIIGHMQFSIRDKDRDKTHGRIWRISNDAKDLLPVLNFADMPVSDLVPHLNAPELRDRYRCRRELWTRNKPEVLAEINTLLDKNLGNERLWLESLWMHQAFNEKNIPLLSQILNGKNPRTRAAGFKALRYHLDDIDLPLERLQKGIEDEAPEVRMQALVTLSFLESEAAAKLALRILEKPGDSFIYFALANTIRHLKPHFNENFWQDSTFAAENQELVRYLYKDEDWALDDLWRLPKTPSLLEEILIKDSFSVEIGESAIAKLTKTQNTSELETLLHLIRLRGDTHYSTNHLVIQQFLNLPPADLKKGREKLVKFVQGNTKPYQRQLAMAAIIKGDQNLNRISQTQKDWLVDVADWTEVAYLLGEENKKLDWSKVLLPLLNSKEIKDQSSAIQTLAYSAEPAPRKIELLLPKLEKTELLEAVLFTLKKITLKKINPETLAPLAKALLVQLNSLSENQLDNGLATDLVELLNTIQPDLPPALHTKIGKIKDQFEIQKIIINTVVSQMKYDVFSFKVKAGKKVKLTLINPDHMPHNLVITVPGSLEKVGKAADKLVGSTTDGKPNYIPEMREVLWATEVVKPGEQEDLIFVAPESPGNYPFVCTYPGHWPIMNGIMIVEGKDEI